MEKINSECNWSYQYMFRPKQGLSPKRSIVFLVKTSCVKWLWLLGNPPLPSSNSHVPSWMELVIQTGVDSETLEVPSWCLVYTKCLKTAKSWEQLVIQKSQTHIHYLYKLGLWIYKVSSSYFTIDSQHLRKVCLPVFRKKLSKSPDIHIKRDSKGSLCPCSCARHDAARCQLPQLDWNLKTSKDWKKRHKHTLPETNISPENRHPQ